MLELFIQFSDFGQSCDLNIGDKSKKVLSNIFEINENFLGLSIKKLSGVVIINKLNLKLKKNKKYKQKALI